MFISHSKMIVIIWGPLFGAVSLLALMCAPEEGLDVIVTGKLTTFSGQSKYQLNVRSIEIAGEGALLKMLEERKKRLEAEGLFAPDKKQAIPHSPVLSVLSQAQQVRLFKIFYIALKIALAFMFWCGLSWFKVKVLLNK